MNHEELVELLGRHVFLLESWQADCSCGESLDYQNPWPNWARHIADLISGSPRRRAPSREIPDDWVELPRRHDLDRRQWRLPSGEIRGEAWNREAMELLRTNPAEYVERTRLKDPDMQRAFDEYMSRERNPERERRELDKVVKWVRRLLGQ
ncbi:Uncharacterised protein [Mycobacteroides abscessus subsp. massiliense]|nr:Uncharacterised protein [Mycobacteroides abscessus subsp. massiliense]SKS89534.1 Uncharacterised protein [Mycobacteroides abscessus subsp. massiliense]SKT23639.1 Uncharacterised protein [Mycobacteroides abscessus subsp. massiliense]SKT52411.1 Uncharacterised protein [Mycobacteroides abscessus subsp. massiliense]SKT91018.1 Uncharacterised protein [Mycobacteroides abscessus subsp. massiliense]